jgi:orotate phosphoribosyltransferase
MNLPGLDLRDALAERGALLEGHFRLSSGRHSDRFVQKFRILEDPVLLESVARNIADRFRALHPSIIVGAAVGGILLAYEVARQLGTKSIFVEKENGLPALRRGFRLLPDDRALIVEDVVTTGLSVRETIEVVRRSGAQIIGFGIVVARGPVTLSLSMDKGDSGDAGDSSIPIHVLLDLPLVSYDEAECPQCREGVPIADPGSRRA